MRFGELSLVAATVGERYGRWQGQECADLRQTLLKKEVGAEITSYFAAPSASKHGTEAKSVGL